MPSPYYVIDSTLNGAVWDTDKCYSEARARVIAKDNIAQGADRVVITRIREEHVDVIRKSNAS